MPSDEFLRETSRILHPKRADHPVTEIDILEILRDYMQAIGDAPRFVCGLPVPAPTIGGLANAMRMIDERCK